MHAACGCFTYFFAEELTFSFPPHDSHPSLRTNRADLTTPALLPKNPLTKSLSGHGALTKLSSQLEFPVAPEFGRSS